MRRWHQERALMLSRIKRERKQHPVADVTESDGCHGLVGVGLVRKRRFHDCGKTRCCVCHREKYLEPKARASKKRAAIDYELVAAG